MTPAHLAAAVQLESNGKNIIPANMIATGNSLCLFPLERNTPYHLRLSGLRAVGEQRMSAPYTNEFSIPDRSPSLAFTTSVHGTVGFASYNQALNLRAVNISQATLTLYRISDPAAMSHAWQDRGQTSIAPSESVYLARTKGQQIWQGKQSMTLAANGSSEQGFKVQEQIPDLAPGLYLLVATADKEAAASNQKRLEPLAATWLTKADFTLRALRDNDGVRVTATQIDTAAAKTDLRLIASGKKQDMIAESAIGADGVGFIPYPAARADAASDATAVVAIDATGGVAMADIDNPPTAATTKPQGLLTPTHPFALPGQKIDVALSLTNRDDSFNGETLLRLMRGDQIYQDIKVAPLSNGIAAVSFVAPIAQDQWSLRWIKTDGALLAASPLRISVNPDAPHLEVSSERDVLSGEGSWPVTVKSMTNTGKPLPLVGGHILLAWQKLDPAAFGWKDYQFGTQSAILNAPAPVGDFVTDTTGTATVRLPLPAHPQERGLYQAILKISADADAGVADAPALVLPLKPDAPVIGIKPLSPEARFNQNGLAGFALIALATDGKPRDMGNLSYQIYAEGRSFSWYQDEGRWNYKPASQLRPIGGGALSIKADGGSTLEWPVTAGNYRLEIIDSTGKTVAQTAFSAGWNPHGDAVTPPLPLALTAPARTYVGHEITAHIALPEAAMVTVVVTQSHIRKIIHEFRAKGDSSFSFTPDANGNTLTLAIDSIAPHESEHRQAFAEIAVTPDKNTPLTPPAASALDVVAVNDPAALVLRKDSPASFAFAIQNNSDAPVSAPYAFSGAAGFTLAPAAGTLSLAPHQSRSLSVSVIGTQPGAKELKLDLGGHPHSWPFAVLAKPDGLRSLSLPSIAPRQSFASTTPASAKSNDDAVIWIARHSMEGAPELLAALFKAQPFTTPELAASIEALRLWKDALSQSGFAPDFVIDAHRQEWLTQLLRHQNSDGGFATVRGGDSTMADTAAALTALGLDNNDSTSATKTLAIGWLKQRLANTWVDETERAPRAAAYAALAAADAIDPASLHYFSDTSAGEHLPALAEVQIAAAFKQKRDPNAAAFWIKKMLDENNGTKPVALLGALASTDALSSDDVHHALADATAALRRGNPIDITEIATLLRAIAADNLDAEKMRVSNGHDTHDVGDLLVLRAASAAAWHSDNDQTLAATLVSPAALPPVNVLQGVNITRHIYRLNGVELTTGTKPVRNEIYMIELKGSTPDADASQRMLLQDGGNNALHPLGCPLSPHLDTTSFMPWFTTYDLTPVTDCEFSPHTLSVTLNQGESGEASLSVVYFATIDAATLNDMPTPVLRVLKE